MSIRIDKNIPLPPPDHAIPWVSLEIGDSFIAPAKSGETPAKTRRRVASAASTASRRNRQGRKYAVRMTAEGVRVWRIA